MIHKFTRKKTYLFGILFLSGLLLVSLSLILFTSQTAVAQDEEANAVRGGQIYDTWWTAIAGGEEEHMEGEEEEHAHEMSGPEEDHPLWATQSTNTRSGADTWRCKECHGWDYLGADGAYGSGSHFTGFPGVMAASSKSVDEVIAALSGGTNPDHDFSTVMDEHDLADLAAFITTSLIDDSELLNADKNSNGDASNGETLYGGVCVLCHGPAGNAINFGAIGDAEFIGHVAGDNPWEFIHKVRFGQPGWPMPSAIGNGWSNQDVADVLAYAETLTTDAALSQGGQLYDKWWEALGIEAPEGDQALWATQSTNTRSGTDTWRCKECHGWDYMGADGVYGSGSHATGFPGVLGAAAMSSDEALGWLNGTANADHDFSGMMDEAALNALVVFLQQEATDISAYVGADGVVNGDPRNGRDLFGETCAACHGVDGRTMNFGSADEPEFVGTIAADNPWEFFHKGSFGQPGEPMPMGMALGWTMQDIADVLAYAQTLPSE